MRYIQWIYTVKCHKYLLGLFATIAQLKQTTERQDVEQNNYQNVPCRITFHLVLLRTHHATFKFLPRLATLLCNYFIILSMEKCLTVHLVGHTDLKDGVVSPLLMLISFLTSLFLLSQKDFNLFGVNFYGCCLWFFFKSIYSND